ncbi:3-carboxy-cis,cis-muconate cycloisomerase, partial [Pseudomonas aeruginosa]|nr:3-carboxy-cis,cis-muconate cycloisomerase [Pseudomonas aeruginosa]
MSDVPANQLFDAYFTAAPMRAVFSDRGRLQGMLDFEAALARAEARTGVVPACAGKIRRASSATRPKRPRPS